MLAVWEHRELVQVFGEPRRGFGDVDKAVLDDRGLCVHPHRLLVGRLVARDAMAALGDQILAKRDWRTNAAPHGRCNFRVSSGVADRKFAAEDLHPRQDGARGGLENDDTVVKEIEKRSDPSGSCPPPPWHLLREYRTLRGFQAPITL